MKRLLIKSKDTLEFDIVLSGNSESFSLSQGNLNNDYRDYILLEPKQAKKLAAALTKALVRKKR